MTLSFRNTQSNDHNGCKHGGEKHLFMDIVGESDPGDEWRSGLCEDFVFTPCDIMPSIKIQDSLSNNESYFYAELLRIKDIIDHASSNPGTLVVLDEILRGTNTKDKHLGSWGLMEKLISLNAVVMIATHDLAIGELENKYPDIVVNHCFEVELTNDQLIFDYKLKNGVSKKLNASFLMKKMGIIS